MSFQYSVLKFSAKTGDKIVPTGYCSGRFLKRALFALLLISAVAAAQSPETPQKKVAAKRMNELTLAGLRPGRDTMHRAKKQYGGVVQYNEETSEDDGTAIWRDPCVNLTLSIDFDRDKKIQVIRVSHSKGFIADCHAVPPSPWKTGRGLRVWDTIAKVVQLYGEPDSRSPSTKDGQPLELWYYAFDWAGPDVPQVMEVLCTKEQDGQPGRVVEITLAAPSL